MEHLETVVNQERTAHRVSKVCLVRPARKATQDHLDFPVIKDRLASRVTLVCLVVRDPAVIGDQLARKERLADQVLWDPKDHKV